MDKAKKSLNITRVLQDLKQLYPEAHCSLTFKNPFQLLCATILSAQCTDERVNKVTPALFKRFPNAIAMSKAKLSELEELVRTTGFYHAKAKSLLETSKMLVTRNDVDSAQGEVPRDLDTLVGFRGVGRKTAHVVLGNAYGIASGVVVDTHVGRLSRRMGFTAHQDPVKVEKDLEKITPPADWIVLPHLFILHGRSVCTARVARCKICVLKDVCPKRGVNLLGG